jgi:hypothetical protein
MVAYAISGLAGAGAAIFLYMSAAWAGPVGWICVAVAIAITIIIEIVKDDKIQEWLKRGCWGCVEGAEPYPSLDVDIKDLELAVS